MCRHDRRVAREMVRVTSTTSHNFPARDSCRGGSDPGPGRRRPDTRTVVRTALRRPPRTVPRAASSRAPWPAPGTRTGGSRVSRASRRSRRFVHRSRSQPPALEARIMTTSMMPRTVASHTAATHGSASSMSAVCS